MRKIFLLLAILLHTFTLIAQDTLEFKATYYAGRYNSRRTASGEIYRDGRLTAASNYYKLGTKVLVINKDNNKHVIVIVNDRMAKYMKGRIDLSKSAFRQIADTRKGIQNVKVTIL